MLKIFTRPKTVTGVFQKFTTDLNSVMQAQHIVADKAIEEQEQLKAKMDASIARQVTAEAEVSQANCAIKNIGELLGVESDAREEESN
jgi:hypothetical protein